MEYLGVCSSGTTEGPRWQRLGAWRRSVSDRTLPDSYSACYQSNMNHTLCEVFVKGKSFCHTSCHRPISDTSWHVEKKGPNIHILYTGRAVVATSTFPALMVHRCVIQGPSAGSDTSRPVQAHSHSSVTDGHVSAEASMRKEMQTQPLVDYQRPLDWELTSCRLGEQKAPLRVGICFCLIRPLKYKHPLICKLLICTMSSGPCSTRVPLWNPIVAPGQKQTHPKLSLMAAPWGRCPP